MKPGFKEALAFTLAWEGGYADYEWDRGGATNFGITQKVYDAWREKERKARRPVREISSTEAEAIYRDDYWYAGRCHLLFWPVSLVHFDTCVNSGPGRAAKLLQTTAGVGADGRIGPVTLKAIELRQRNILAMDYCASREQYVRRLARVAPEDYAPALKGWLNRINALRRRVQEGT